MEESGNNIELATNHAKKIDNIKKDIPENVLRLFGIKAKDAGKKKKKKEVE